jgi:predicted helicase
MNTAMVLHWMSFFLFDNSGIKTHRDNLVISYDMEVLEDKIHSFFSEQVSNDEVVRLIDFKPKKGWDLKSKRKGFDRTKIKRISFRPFDDRYIYYDINLVDRARENLVRHLTHSHENYCLVFMRQYAYEVPDYCYISITRNMIDNRYFISNKGICQGAPLYLISNDLGNIITKNPNITPNIYSKLKDSIPDMTPENVFDYIYAVLQPGIPSSLCRISKIEIFHVFLS